MEKVLFRNATVADGLGGTPFPGSVLVEGGVIAAVGAVHAPDAREVDCTGLTVCPGFIDAHSHSDLEAMAGRREKSLQGVTCEVVGNCGFSAFPAAADHAPLHEFANGILHGGGDWGWTDARGYLAEASRKAQHTTLASMIGHGTLRIKHAGHAAGPLSEETLRAMERDLDEALEQGACGFSTGLMYAPGSNAGNAELERLCRVVARHGSIHATHMRDYAFKLPEAVDEQIELARRTGCRLQISHLQAVGPVNWHLQQRAIESIERARAEGVDVEFDCYPYIAGSTVLTQWLPQWTLEGGLRAMLARLADGELRRRIAEETIAMMAHRWSDLVVSAVASQANRALVGRTLEDIAATRGCAPIDAAFDLLTEEAGAVNILEFNQSEENLRQTLTHPLSCVVSDGFYVDGKPHPRLHGAFAEWLGKYARDRAWVTLGEAVAKITSRPAARFGLRGRGVLEPGATADVTVIDFARIASPATYDQPERPPVGVAHVMRAGRFVIGGPKQN